MRPTAAGSVAVPCGVSLTSNGPLAVAVIGVPGSSGKVRVPVRMQASEWRASARARCADVDTPSASAPVSSARPAVSRGGPHQACSVFAFGSAGG